MFSGIQGAIVSYGSQGLAYGMQGARVLHDVFSNPINASSGLHGLSGTVKPACEKENTTTKKIVSFVTQIGEVFGGGLLLNEALNAAGVSAQAAFPYIGSVSVIPVVSIAIPFVNKSVVFLANWSGNKTFKHLAKATDQHLGDIARVVSTASGVALLAMGAPLLSPAGLALGVNALYWSVKSIRQIRTSARENKKLTEVNKDLKLSRNEVLRELVVNAEAQGRVEEEIATQIAGHQENIRELTRQRDDERRNKERLEGDHDADAVALADATTEQERLQGEIDRIQAEVDNLQERATTAVEELEGAGKSKMKWGAVGFIAGLATGILGTAGISMSTWLLPAFGRKAAPELPQCPEFDADTRCPPPPPQQQCPEFNTTTMCPHPPPQQQCPEFDASGMSFPRPLFEECSSPLMTPASTCPPPQSCPTFDATMCPPPQACVSAWDMEAMKAFPPAGLEKGNGSTCALGAQPFKMGFDAASSCPPPPKCPESAATVCPTYATTVCPTYRCDSISPPPPAWWDASGFANQGTAAHECRLVAVKS